MELKFGVWRLRLRQNYSTVRWGGKHFRTDTGYYTGFVVRLGRNVLELWRIQ